MIHTKEPWEIRKGSLHTYIIGKDGNGNDVTVASVFPRGVAGCETEGNAYLMKAAPKMAEALLKVRELINAFNGMLLIKESDKGIVGTMDALLDNPIFEEALAEAEGKE